ncbi:hypothetical protein E9993_14725 [Labilibacter sediminis]|nr:hypothetical protein E9993_14725 [Labilibacter sediminis]
MKNLNEEQIDTIEQMAELFYSPEEIAINIEVKSDELTAELHVDDSNVRAAYLRGWLKGDISLRKGIAQAAANGSNPAQQMMREIQKENKIGL